MVSIINIHTNFYHTTFFQGFVDNYDSTSFFNQLYAGCHNNNKLWILIKQATHKHNDNLPQKNSQKGMGGVGWWKKLFLDTLIIVHKKKSFARSFSAVILFLKSGSRQSAAISASGASWWHLMHCSLRVLSLSRATNPSTSGVGVDDEGRVMGDDTIVRWTCTSNKQVTHQY